MKQLNSLCGSNFPSDNQIHYRPLIFKDLVHHTKHLLRLATDCGIELGDSIDQPRLMKASYRNLDEQLSTSSAALWNDVDLLHVTSTYKQTSAARYPTKRLRPYLWWLHQQ